MEVHPPAVALVGTGRLEGEEAGGWVCCHALLAHGRVAGSGLWGASAAVSSVTVAAFGRVTPTPSAIARTPAIGRTPASVCGRGGSPRVRGAGAGERGRAGGSPHGR